MEAGLPVPLFIGIFVGSSAEVRAAANQSIDVLAHKRLLRVEQNGSAFVDQGCVAGIRQGYSRKGFRDSAQTDICAGHAFVLTALHRRKRGDNHVVGAGILVRFGK